MKIYFVAALAYASPEFKKDVANLKNSLKMSFELLEFFGDDKAADPNVIFTQDVQCVRNCDVILAECSEPSTGMGFEIGMGLSLGKKVIALAREGVRISAMIEGNPDITIVRYVDLVDALSKILVTLKQV